jgi:hypothetical protein
MNRAKTIFLTKRALLFVTLTATMFQLAACKARTNETSLKGLTIDQSSKEIDYATLFSKNEITISQIVAYESSYYRHPNSNGASDEGVAAAFKMIWWLKNNARIDLFKGRMVVEEDSFPDNGRQVSLDQIYRFRARVEGIAVKTGTVSRSINAKINVILGPSISSSRGMAMPEDFRKELVRAFTSDDIVSYNGHIWTVESQSQRSPFLPAPVDANTEKLADAIAAAGGRKHYGIIYMNACHGEKIENALMDAMIGDNADRRAEPILMSHRNYSNYGYFADHNAKMLVNLFNSRSLAKVILDMTSTVNPAWLKKNEAQDPATTLQRYYNTPGVRENPRSVVIVAYDVIRKRPISIDD